MDSSKRFWLSLLIVGVLAGWALYHFLELDPVDDQKPINTTLSPDMDLRALEKSIHLRINRQRERFKLDPLTWNRDLGELARTHSNDMAMNRFFAHLNQRGFTPSQRAEFAGFSCLKNPAIRRQPKDIGENIFMGRLYETAEGYYEAGERRTRYTWKPLEHLAREVVSSWMNDDAMRARILNRAYHLHGIGVALNEKYEVFVTQDLC